MAQKRMFNNLVIGSDDFMEMPDSSQNLYFHLSMKADDDGFVDNWKSVMRMTRKTSDDIKILIEKKFIIPFDTGVIVIRHWRLNNYLRNDRYKETIYKNEKSTLEVDNTGAYKVGIPNGYQMDTNGIRSIDKNSIDKKKNKKEKKKKSFEDVFSENDFSKELEDTLRDFIDMRKAIKKPMTTKALELLIKNLEKLTNLEAEKIAILNQSIEHSWQTVYPLKIENSSSNSKSNKKAVDTSRLTQEEYTSLMRKEISIEELIEKGRVDVL